jgi:DNA-binding IclR family transcriptional regulator
VLNVAHGGSYRTVAAVDARGPLGCSPIVGHVMPGHAGCSGRALFAGQPLEEVRELFGSEQLTRYTSDNEVPVAAAVYHDDMFVDRDQALESARMVRNARIWVTNEYEHDGVKASPAVLDRLLAMNCGEA